MKGEPEQEATMNIYARSFAQAQAKASEALADSLNLKTTGRKKWHNWIKREKARFRQFVAQKLPQKSFSAKKKTAETVAYQRFQRFIGWSE